MRSFMGHGLDLLRSTIAGWDGLIWSRSLDGWGDRLDWQLQWSWHRILGPSRVYLLWLGLVTLFVVDYCFLSCDLSPFVFVSIALLRL